MKKSVAEALTRMGQSLRTMREERGLSQVAVGKLIGRENSSISRIEDGHSTHTATLFAIAEELGGEIVVRPRARTLAQRHAEDILQAFACGELRMESLSIELRMRLANMLAFPDAARAG